MGMLIDGIWDASSDRSMRNGTYRRETSAMPTKLDANMLDALGTDPSRFVLIASASCPWSHGTVIASVIKGLADRLPVQWAGGARIEGYALLPKGPISADSTMRHVHQLYTRTDPHFTGRTTVPILWDASTGRILSNSSGDIIEAFDQVGTGPDLFPQAMRADINALTLEIFDGLSNAVYRAGKAQRQDEYDEAVNCVFETMAGLDDRLSDQMFLFGEQLTGADIRLFATLVRFDTVYATHFRCTRKRLVDHLALWRFTRRFYQMLGIRQTIDFEEIRFGYYINDGSHNPFGIIVQQPIIDWDDTTGL